MLQENKAAHQRQDTARDTMIDMPLDSGSFAQPHTPLSIFCLAAERSSAAASCIALLLFELFIFSQRRNFGRVFVTPSLISL